MSIAERDDTLMAQVAFGAVVKDVCLAYIPDAAVGEYVIVHVGFAIQRLDERSALETLNTFAKLGILDEEFGVGLSRAANAAGAGSDAGATVGRGSDEVSRGVQ